jgi:hypothetical protein
VDPRAGLDNKEKKQFLTLLELELLPLRRPSRSRLLYRLSYPGSQVITYNHILTNILVIKAIEVKLYIIVREMEYQDNGMKNAREK